MTTLSERTLGLSGRVTTTGDRPRDLQEVTLLLVDGTRIRGESRAFVLSQTSEEHNVHTRNRAPGGSHGACTVSSRADGHVRPGVGGAAGSRDDAAGSDRAGTRAGHAALDS